ncbi:Nuclear receptor 2C2-associated protein [Chamberlinius hualienensis]
MESLLPICTFKVSSVLNRETKRCGKQFMFDGNDETCWNSDQGTPQWIHVDFSKEVIPKELHIRFQGGFTGKDCSIQGQSENEIDVVKLHSFYPEDNNSLQVFPLPVESTQKSLRIMFNNSTDFFGRIVVYDLNIYGNIS